MFAFKVALASKFLFSETKMLRSRQFCGYNKLVVNLHHVAIESPATLSCFKYSTGVRYSCQIEKNARSALYNRPELHRCWANRDNCREPP